jgi:dTDP-4-dehydrorhamnose 3,5-epimerase
VIFEPTPLAGAWLLAPERHEDERGFFARTFCRRELGERGLATGIVQASTSFNCRRGTVRGMHYQVAPDAEAKLVRCTRGALFDAVVDLRETSPTRGRHFAVVLSAEAGNQLYVPPGLAHGFQTLEDETEVHYLISAFFAPESARGFRYDDPEVAIPWPEPVTAISERDLALPPFAECASPGVGAPGVPAPGVAAPGGAA